MTAPQTTVDERRAQFGRYQLDRLLSRGGMGEVYLASMAGAAGFHKRVCIKKILPHLAREQEFVDRFVDEAHILVHLTHGNIVPVLDMGEVGGEYFIAMEYIAGRDLRDILKTYERAGERMPAPLAAWVVGELARALSYAHKKTDDSGTPLHIIHRDVSPSNVLVSREGVVKLTDFGIAKAVTKLGKSITGRLQGKFCYMSPEQARGQSVDARSDTFSLGALAYELLTGERPFEEDSDLGTLEAVKRAEVDPPSVLVPALSGEVDAAVLRALARDPADRYTDVADFGRALTTAVAGLGTASESEMEAELGRLYPEGVESSGVRSLDQLLAAGAEALLASEWSDDTVTASAPSRGVPALTPAALTPSALSPPLTPQPGMGQMTPSSPYEVVPTAAAWKRPLLSSAMLLVLAGLVVIALYVWPGLLLPGELAISCNAEGASVSVDGIPVGQCPVVADDLDPGEHTVSAAREGFVTTSTLVSVRRGERVEVPLELAPSPIVSGVIWIENPDGRPVGGRAQRLDESDAFYASGVSFDVAAGTYEFDIQPLDEAGLDPTTVSLTINRENTVHHVRLSRAEPVAEAPASPLQPTESAEEVAAGEPEDATGHERPRIRRHSLTLTDLPDGAEVEHDGNRESAQNGRFSLQARADAGVQHVTVTAPGHQPVTLDFDPSADDQTRSVALEPLETRYVRIWTIQVPGQVTIDGWNRGDNNSNFQLAVGSHTVRFASDEPGLCEDQQTIRVEDNDEGRSDSAPQVFTFCR